MNFEKKTLESRRERKKEATKKKIIEVAVNLFNQQGYEETTMEQIAQEVDIAKATLYNYFSSKELIICDYVRGSVKDQGPEIISLMEDLPDTKTRLYVFLDKALEWVDDHGKFAEIYFAYRMQNILLSISGDESLRSGIFNTLIHLIVLGQRQGEIINIPPGILANQFSFIHTTTVLGWLKGVDIPKEEFIQLQVDLFLNGASKKNY